MSQCGHQPPMQSSPAPHKSSPGPTTCSSAPASSSYLAVQPPAAGATQCPQADTSTYGAPVPSVSSQIRVSPAQGGSWTTTTQKTTKVTRKMTYEGLADAGGAPQLPGGAPQLTCETPPLPIA